MGFVISLILITFGAILTWAVDANGGTVDPQVVGVILMVIGIVVFAISIVLWRTWWGVGFWGGMYDEGAGGAPPGLLADHEASHDDVRRGRATPARAVGLRQHEEDEPWRTSCRESAWHFWRPTWSSKSS